jgi:hypothetical protein
MGLAAGGRMRQVIHPDLFDIEDWDISAADRVFVSLMHAKDWKTITGQAAPNEPPAAKDYSNAGLPWFDHYGKDQTALPGIAKLAEVSSLAKLFKKKTGAKLPNSQDIETGQPKAIGPGAKGPRLVRTSSSWEM